MNQQPRFQGPSFVAVERLQASVLADRERRLLDWLCAHLPVWVTPDQLTLVGFLGAFAAAAGYAASGISVTALWFAILGIAVHWFGDSLDGSLARHRRCERPAYGYFLDHAVDALSIVLMVGGLGLTPFVRIDSALAALLAYQLLCIYVYLDAQVSGVFRLSFLAVGPTELRLSLILLVTAMIAVGDVGMRIGTVYLTIYDCALLLVAACAFALFVERVFRRVVLLRASPIQTTRPAEDPARTSSIH